MKHARVLFVLRHRRSSALSRAPANVSACHSRLSTGSGDSLKAACKGRTRYSQQPNEDFYAICLMANTLTFTLASSLGAITSAFERRVAAMPDTFHIALPD